MPIRTLAVAALALALSTAPKARGGDDTFVIRAPPPITLDMAAALRADPQPPGQEPTPPPPTEISKPFGKAGSEFLTFGLGYSNDFDNDQAGELHGAYSRFLGDELEFSLELSAWYFDQIGDNTAGLNPTLNFRWHFLHDEAFDWTVYGDVGIGVLFAFDNVPDTGTGFNFTPRIGGGFTKALEGGLRLQIGARWAHISNGRIAGNERNPGRDSLMIYAGIIIPF